MPPRLPPLNALKAFEAAARLGGYVLAAQELGVSPAAVSQQVKTLERFFEKKLFIRHNNRISLSDAGLAVYGEIGEALEQIAGVTARVFDDTARAPLVISVLPSLASRWLNACLPDYAMAERGLRLDLRVEEDPVDFARQGIDVRLCYGEHLYPDYVTTPFLRDSVLPLAAPSFLEHRAEGPLTPRSLADGDLIHTSWGPSFASHPSWADWFKAARLDRTPEPGRGHRVGMSSLAIDLAVAGMGVALGQRLLAEAEIAAGRLTAPFGPALRLGQPYCTVHAHAKARKAGVRRFVEWVSDTTHVLREAGP